MTFAAKRNARGENVARVLIGVMLSLAFVTLFAVATPSHAHHLLPPHQLNCSANFPCPPEIRRRVHFWIEVFRSWDKETAVFHDPNRPQRIYAVYKSGSGCGRDVRKRLKRKRNDIKKALHAIAAKLDAKKRITDPFEQHFVGMFIGKPAAVAKEMRAAANNIRCQGGVRDSFVAGLKRYQHHRDMIEAILQETGLPQEIRYLPFVESSFNPAAYSKAGAAGMWQIMPKTARRLGLKLNATLDERLDPEAATRAAALYLKRANKSLSEIAREQNPNITEPQLNPFIITSYNYGVTGMRRAIKKVSPDFMAVLNEYKSPRFRTAVKNFYASFLAARHVARNADKYFDAAEIKADVAEQTNTVILAHPTSIGRIKQVFGVTETQLRPHNRAFTRFVWRGWRLIPAGYRLRLPARADDWQAARLKLAAMRPESVNEFMAGGGYYQVRRGDTACGIARALKVNCSQLISANNLGRTALITVGQKLLIPHKATQYARLTSKPDPLPGDGIYRVRKGDTACAIAKRFGLDCRTLIGQNQLGQRAVIYPGQKLFLPAEVLSAPRGKLNTNNQYVVRRGDSACRVAQQFSVNCTELIKLNRLNANAVIHPGQKLNIPGLVVPGTSETAERLARVDDIRSAPSADAENDALYAPPSRTTAWGIVAEVAGEFDGAFYAGFDVGVSENAIAQITTAPEQNDDGASGELVQQQPQDIPDTIVPVEVVNHDANTLRNLLDTLPDLGVRVSGAADSPVYAVRVEADETLGYFADWLGIAGTDGLRVMNALNSNDYLDIGQQILLPVSGAEMSERFEQRRTDYHQVLSESLKEHFDLVGIENHIVRAGDSPWSLSVQLEFPLWLLYRLNPVLREAPLVPGQVVLLPKLKEKV